MRSAFHEQLHPSLNCRHTSASRQQGCRTHAFDVSLCTLRLERWATQQNSHTKCKTQPP